ncbi:zinc finger protein with KRAB and SCAN domains 2 isoform X2 [Acanthochromis polyacanthus]|uniref:Zinc finger protein with KRAB and SCAN domains 2-like n=1 Tax=Acanthochromis polyacanthus TaxID=80966 RepID=A0A3Q1H2M4_9TELE|nr:zinc finger protein with KRAB and SCAN domains 2 isoform X2 [Acanthochromis polyacanthus]
MESCSFQSQLLSVMEVLAKAAVEEINRRVEDSCAVLRLEVSQSRRDIELLKTKCEVMEAELRRSRLRARRKGERCSPLVKVVPNTESQRSDWDRHMDAEATNQLQQCADLEAVNEADRIQIKEECAEEDTWRSEPDHRLISGAEQLPCFEATPPARTDSFAERYHSSENPANPESLVPPTDSYNTFPEQQLNRNQDEAELVVKHEKEEEPKENAAPLDSTSTFATEEADAQLWPTNLCRDAADPGVSFARQQFEQIPAVFASQTSLHLEDMAPRIPSVDKTHSVVVVSAARVKRRAKSFGFKRPQPDEGHSALSQINSLDSSLIQQHQYRDAAPLIRNPNEDLMSPNSTASLSRGSFGLVRRMRVPWRSGLCEKRFSCSYCDKSFTRFSQLKEHLRSHTGEKPFSCMQCGRSFTKQCNLIRHAVVHSGEKPHECTLCGKCFTQRSSLKSHQKTAH